MIRLLLIFLLVVVACSLAPSTQAQTEADTSVVAGPAKAGDALPDAPQPAPQNQASGYEGKQTRRILGIVPNFRSVSVDEKLPPISKHNKFKLTMEDSFDYSSFIYVGILAGVSQAEGSYPEFHSGGPAFARYYWHNFADTLDGNLMTEFVLPVTTKEDPRYYTLERGGIVKRSAYSISRLSITRTDSGGASPNFSEIVGNGAAAGISGFYYPSQERTWTKTGQRWVTQVGLDGFSDLVKEFWPDLNARVFHNKY